MILVTRDPTSPLFIQVAIHAPLGVTKILQTVNEAEGLAAELLLVAAQCKAEMREKYQQVNDPDHGTNDVKYKHPCCGCEVCLCDGNH